jgi:hypothetical protein
MSKQMMSYFLLLTVAPIALASTGAIAHAQVPLQEHLSLSDVLALQGKPGLPRRRVGGGSRLY